MPMGPVHKTVTMTGESTPHKCTMQTTVQDMEGKVHVWPKLLWTGHSYTHSPELSLPPIPGNTSSFWQEVDKATCEGSKKSCAKVLALFHRHIRHVYSSLSSKDKGLFLPVVGHFLMSILWCWSWQTGQTEGNLSLLSFNCNGETILQLLFPHCL